MDKMTDTVTAGLGRTESDVLLVPSDEVASRIIEGEALLVLPSKGEALVLNDVGTRVWQLIAESRTMKQIVSSLQEEYDADAAQLEKDVAAFCAELQSRGLLSLPPPAAPLVEGSHD